MRDRRAERDAAEGVHPWSVYEPRVQAHANRYSPDMGGLDVGCRAALREIARLNAELEAARAVVEAVGCYAMPCDASPLGRALKAYDAAKAGKAVE